MKLNIKCKKCNHSNKISVGEKKSGDVIYCDGCSEKFYLDNNMLTKSKKHKRKKEIYIVTLMFSSILGGSALGIDGFPPLYDAIWFCGVLFFGGGIFLFIFQNTGGWKRVIEYGSSGGGKRNKDGSRDRRFKENR